VTSRNRLSGLVARHDARRTTVDLLSSADATRLLTSIIGAARAAAEPEATARLTHLCGYLPLALRIAAEQIAADPGLKLADLAHDLARERARLNLLTTDDEMTAIRAAFSWSYRTLGPEPAQAFRLLGLNPGADISLAAAAALAGRDVDTARRVLGVLTGVHLLQEPARDRYRFHDLVRLYAAEVAAGESPQQRSAAQRRLLSWYFATAIAADRVIAPRRRNVAAESTDIAATPLRLASYGEAVSWCEAERANLVAATRLAAEVGEDAIAWKLPVVLGSFFNLRKHWDDWIATHRIGAAAAGRLGDRTGQAWCLTGLGIAYGDLRRFDESVENYQRALTAHREVGDRLGEASTLNNLGITYGELNRHRKATGCLEQALGICRQIGDRRGEGMTLDSLGIAYRNLRQFSDAIDALRQALAICQEIGDGRGAGFALNNLGDTYLDYGQPDEAIAHFRLALETRRAAGDRRGEAQTLDRLAIAQRATGQREAARSSLKQAHAIFVELGDPQSALTGAALEREVADGFRPRAPSEGSGE
jgi:tetratricopeptide (TPR) repeat protein